MKFIEWREHIYEVIMVFFTAEQREREKEEKRKRGPIEVSMSNFTNKKLMVSSMKCKTNAPEN